ncbi:MAG: hypothetical protein ACI9EF_002409 [Pseudohongiellaceae bacterium]|jgi:hypothetical protein
MTAPSVQDRSSAEAGAVLIEFTLVALAFVLLAGATIELGRATFYSQAAQSAARLAARELSLVPLPAGMTFEQSLNDSVVRQRVYDPRWLAIDLDNLDNPDTVTFESTLDELFGTLPSVNRALRPLMINDQPVVGGATRRLLRFPGALLASGDPGVEFTVQVPIVLARDGTTGTETNVAWAHVLEEQRSDRLDPSTGSFSVTSPGGGLVAVRINVPFQANMLAGYQQGAGGVFDVNAGQPIEADDSAVLGGPQPLDGASFLLSANDLVADIPGPRAYAGPAGLGSLYSFGKVVRPFRKVFAAQALSRREIVLP